MPPCEAIQHRKIDVAQDCNIALARCDKSQCPIVILLNFDVHQPLLRTRRIGIQSYPRFHTDSWQERVREDAHLEYSASPLIESSQFTECGTAKRRVKTTRRFGAQPRGHDALGCAATPPKE